MNQCPLTYLPCGDRPYRPEGLKRLSAGLVDLQPLGYSAEEQRKEAFLRSGKLSIQGVQPKLSAVLNASEGRFGPPRKLH